MKNNVNVAVVCAFNPKNAGMYSVDLAAKQVFTELGVRHKLFVAQAIPYRGSRLLVKVLGRAFHPGQVQFGEIKYAVLNRPEQFESFSHVLYWGDFLNNPVYGVKDFATRDVMFKHSVNRQDGFKRWKSLFVDGPLKSGKKIGAIGGNFQHSGQYSASWGGGILRQVVNGFDLFMPRDPVSLQVLKAEAAGSSKTDIYAGMDCAFLLETNLTVAKSDMFSFHFGRSGFTQSKEFINALSWRTKLKPTKLRGWFDLEPRTAQNDFLELQRSILSSQFVVTDTYHVSVNALRLGVPVFCLGRSVASQEGTLGDFKKKTLFEMLGCNQLYLPQEAEVEESIFMKECVDEISERYQLRQFQIDSASSYVLGMSEKINRKLRRFLAV